MVHSVTSTAIALALCQGPGATLPHNIGLVVWQNCNKLLHCELQHVHSSERTVHDQMTYDHHKDGSLRHSAVFSSAC